LAKNEVYITLGFNAALVKNLEAFLLLGKEGESLLEVVISPCINHSGRGRTNACAIFSSNSKHYEQKDQNIGFQENCHFYNI
jgi:hypothetical protein